MLQKTSTQYLFPTKKETAEFSIGCSQGIVVVDSALVIEEPIIRGGPSNTSDSEPMNENKKETTQPSL